MAVNSISSSSGAPAASGAPATAPASEGAAFAQVLRDQLAAGRERVAGVRAEIEALRNGGPLRAAVPPSAPQTESTGTYAAAWSAGGSDPFGWRAMTRSVGDAVVAPGFGAIFERQIAQESGFAPDVVFGLRTSSAGAEGIAQLMPAYYPGVDRSNPEEALVAGARTMRHYLGVFDGDVRKALAAYNAGLGRVQALEQAHGEGWERALPAETRDYLAAILGDETYLARPQQPVDAAVFGGRGPGGVLVRPVDAPTAEQLAGDVLWLRASEGAAVRAPADGRVVDVIADAGGGVELVLDHGNGWQSRLRGVDGLTVAQGDEVARGAVLGAPATAAGWVGLEVASGGVALDPSRYLLDA